MKILAASDIHGDSNLAKALAERAEKEKVDLVVLCGDLTFHEQSTSNLIGPFVKKNKKVILIPGNHETIATADFLADMYNVTNLHGYSIKFNNIGFFARPDMGFKYCGGQFVYHTSSSSFTPAAECTPHAWIFGLKYPLGVFMRLSGV